MTRLEKQQLVSQFTETYACYPCMIVVRQSHIRASAVAQLRRESTTSGIIFRVVKNTLAKRALSDQSHDLSDAFKGPTGVFLAHDPVAIAKLISSFGKKREDHFFPLMGILNGTLLKGGDILKLASLPSLDQIRAQILNLINAPAVRLLSTVKEPGQQVARVLNAHCQKH